MAYQTIGDLLNADAMQQAQIGAMGQESQLRQLQMQQAQKGVQDQEQLRALLPQLMQGGDPQGMLKSLMMSGNPQAMEMAGKMAPLLMSMQKSNNITYEDFGGYKQGKNEQGSLVGDRIEKTAAPKEFQPSDLSRLTTEMNSLQPGDQRIEMYKNAINKLTTHQPAANTTIKLPSNKGYTKLAENDADAISQMAKDAVAGARSLPAIRALNRNEGGAYSGMFAPGQVAFSQFMSAIGVNDPKLQKALVSSELFNQSSDEYAAMILKPLMGSTQLSNTDLAFVKGIVPRLQNQPESRRELLQYAEKRVNQLQSDYQSARKHYESNDASLTGWQPSQPADNIAPQQPKRTISRQEILQTAGKAMKTPAQVAKDAVAAGYSVEGM